MHLAVHKFDMAPAVPYVIVQRSRHSIRKQINRLAMHMLLSKKDEKNRLKELSYLYNIIGRTIKNVGFCRISDFIPEGLFCACNCFNEFTTL